MIDYAWISLANGILKQNGYLVSFGSIFLLTEIAKTFKFRFNGTWLKPRGALRTYSAKKPMNKFESYCVYTNPLAKISELVWNKTTYPAEPYQKVQRKSEYKRGGKDQIDRANASNFTVDRFVCENSGYRYYTDVIEGNSKQCMKHEERTIHPTQKPINVMEVLIGWTTNENNIIIDLFCGSGTTLVAAKRLKRKCWGIEMNEEYCEIAKQRIIKEDERLL